MFPDTKLETQGIQIPEIQIQVVETDKEKRGRSKGLAESRVSLEKTLSRYRFTL